MDFNVTGCLVVHKIRMDLVPYCFESQTHIVLEETGTGSMLNKQRNLIGVIN